MNARAAATTTSPFDRCPDCYVIACETNEQKFRTVYKAGALGGRYKTAVCWNRAECRERQEATRKTRIASNEATPGAGYYMGLDA